MIDSVYWIWFQLVFGVGTRRSHLMLEHFENPQIIYEGVVSGGAVGEMLTAEEKGRCAGAMERAQSVWRRTLKKGCEVVTPDHVDYPERLQTIFAKPAALYVKGDLSCLKNNLCICMVGPRKSTEYGRQVAALLSRQLASVGAVIVSGLANGIDSVSHQAALEAGGKTVGVLGCGIDVDYPRDSSALKRAASENGAVVTEFPLGSEPKPFHFPLRNRILSGLSHGVVVVEAAVESGALLTAQHALEQNRDVFAVPGSIFSETSAGVHALLRDGAKPVGSVEDILEEYPRFKKNPTPMHNLEENPTTINIVQARDGNQTGSRDEPKEPERKTPPDSLSPAGLELYGLMDAEGASVEELASKLSLDMGKLLAALTELELYDLIQPYPGRRFGLK